MKTCPVCHAVAFDDAETCFGCMHRFGEGRQEEASAPVDVPPEFRIRFTPVQTQAGSFTWSCAVEV